MINITLTSIFTAFNCLVGVGMAELYFSGSGGWCMCLFFFATIANKAFLDKMYILARGGGKKFKYEPLRAIRR